MNPTARPSCLAALIGAQMLIVACASAICDDRERAMLEEFAQYPGASGSAEPNFDTGACARYYRVTATREELHGYFASQLASHGWNLEEASPPGTLIAAHRGACSYVVYIEIPRAAAETTMNVAAHLSCD